MTNRTLRLLWTSVADLADLHADLVAGLPIKEQERTARFGIDAARHRFVLARTVLRRHLGAALGVDPMSLVFAAGDRGKPALASPTIEDPPHFNLSHSGDVVAVAVAPADVGVDIEVLREISNAERMARRFFSLDEQSIINDLGGATRDRAFLRIWTQKEAYLKATGLGVGMPLREVETEADPANPPHLHAIGGDRAEAESWTLLEAEIPGAVCTVAIRGPRPMLEVRQFTPTDLEAKWPPRDRFNEETQIHRR